MWPNQEGLSKPAQTRREQHHVQQLPDKSQVIMTYIHLCEGADELEHNNPAPAMFPPSLSTIPSLLLSIGNPLSTNIIQISCAGGPQTLTSATNCLPQLLQGHLPEAVYTRLAPTSHLGANIKADSSHQCNQTV